MTDKWYDEKGLFRDDIPSPVDCVRVTYLLHVISRHRRRFKVEIGCDGAYGSGQYQVSIVPHYPKDHEFFGYGCGDTLEEALFSAVASVEELRPFISDEEYPREDGAPRLAYGNADSGHMARSVFTHEANG